MSRLAGPPRLSTDHDRPAATGALTLNLSPAFHVFRALCSSLLLLLIGVSALPAAHTTAVPASAAAFAVAGLVGAAGDPPLAGSAASAGDDALAQADGLGGTLSFGDPFGPVSILPLVPNLTLTGGDTATTPAPTQGAPTATPVDAPAPTPEVTPPAPAAPTADPQTGDQGDALTIRGLRVAQVARRYIGARYRYGAAGPRAFDCSGLTLFVYRQFGVMLPHQARAQFSARYGQHITSMSKLRPGDLVFFRNTAGRGITHAAIYVGNGMMVTANTPRTGVQLAAIGSAYWQRHYAGAIRPSL